MKSILLALALTLSTQAMAKIPATDAVTNLIAAGKYVGTNAKKECSVKIDTRYESVSIYISTGKAINSYAIVNSANNYSVDELGNISATQSLNAPFYLNGGTQILNIKKVDTGVLFSIATIALDHKGNDYSTYSTCTVNY